MTYYGYHIPSGENWLILGIDYGRGRVCAAGWPATIANLSDIQNMEVSRPRTEKETEYVIKMFGYNFLNKE
jgi:hypothetical protein